ncbi:MAG: hypothetical protein II625_05875 [Bacilli bacterium]|nr:hypothetical protein [Bacilli bacterium]
MNKKYYLLLIFVFALSALLLGFSYSKDSGDDVDLKLIQDYSDYFRVVYSTDRVLNKDNKKIDFGITNISDSNQDYVIKLINNTKDNVYYLLDGESERKLEKEIIFTSSLTKNGDDGDYVMHTLEITSENDFNVTLEINILDTSLKAYLEEAGDVFIDNNGNYRFFGEHVNNYINIDNEVYRMVGLINGKIRVIGEASSIARYVTNNDYLSVEDYILSYDKHDLSEDNLYGNSSWLNIDYRYWLESDDQEIAKMVDADVGVRTDSKSKLHYQRIIKEFDGDVKVVKGNGTIANPYEVSYGSK